MPTRPTFAEIEKAVAVLVKAGWWVEFIQQGDATRIQLRSHAATGVHRTTDGVLSTLRSQYEPKAQ